MGKKRFFLIVMLLLIGLLSSTKSMLAGPVEPSPVELQQPNGVAFMAAPFGDEWYSGYEHDGYTILLDETTGYFVYAEQTASGALQPTSLKVAIDSPAGLPQHVRDESGAYNTPPHVLPNIAPQVWPGVSGTQPVLLLLVDFTPSESLGTTAVQWNSALFDSTPGVKSVSNFYTEASYGNFTISPAAETQGTANDGIIEVTGMVFV